MTGETSLETSDCSVSPPRPRRSGRARSESATISSSNLPPMSKRRKRVIHRPSIQDVPEEEEYTDEEPGVDLEYSPSHSNLVMTQGDDVTSDLATLDPTLSPRNSGPVLPTLLHTRVPTTPFSPRRILPTAPTALSAVPPGPPSPSAGPLSPSSRPLSPDKARRRRAAKQPASSLASQLPPGTAEEYMRSGTFQGPFPGSTPITYTIHHPFILLVTDPQKGLETR